MNERTFTVGWVTDARWPYRNVMASTRIRCLDIIRFLKNSGIKTDLYRPFEKYDIVIFQKSFSESHYKLAKKLSNAGIKIILDINVNYFVKAGETTQVTEKQIEDLHRFLGLTNTIFVSSHYLQSVAERYHSDVHYIPEHISTIGSHLPKKLSNPVKLLYCGYAVKANSVFLIEDVLSDLSKEYDIEVVFVCEKNPSLKLPIKTSFIKYKHKNLVSILRQGDIKVAPRGIGNSYDLGHSFTKIGYPMSVGLPVVASPVPSYEGSPALLSTSEGEWMNNIKSLIENPEEYRNLSRKGIAFVKENFSLKKIGQMYLESFGKVYHD